jgi:hypothetical protein
MTDAPERIWAVDLVVMGEPWSHIEALSKKWKPVSGKKPVEYRRADAPPTVAEAMTVPEVRALVGALTVAIEVAEDEGLDGLAKEWRAVIAAIRAREGGKP